MAERDDQHGLRVRLGIVSPDDGINDDEFWRYSPDDVTLLWTRYRTPRRFDPITVEMVGAYGDEAIVADAAQTLTITRPQAVGFSCNSCTFVRGADADQRIRAEISRACGGCPATTVSHAQVEALRALRVSRVALGAPYAADVTAKLQQFLLAHDIDVVASRSLGLQTEWQIGNTPADAWYRVAVELDWSDVQAIVLACSGIRTFDVHARVERELGKPLISAPAVLVWHLLRIAGVASRGAGTGMLMEIR